MRSLILRVTFNNTITDLDIDQDLPLRVDMSAIENTSIGQVFGIGSQTIDLPGTPLNNKFFKHAYKVEAVDVPAVYNKIEAALLVNGESMLEGKLSLDDTITDDSGFIVYKVSITDNVIGLVRDLESRLIKDLDFSRYDHLLTKENIVKSWNHPTSSNSLFFGSIFYPLADYGSDDVVEYPTMPRIQLDRRPSIPNDDRGSINHKASPMRVQQFLPSIRSKDLIDTIFSDVNYTYTSSFLNSDNFKQTYVLPKSNDKLGITTPGGWYDAIVSMSLDLDIPAIPPLSIRNFNIPFTAEVVDKSNSYDTNFLEYTVPVTGEYTIDLYIELDNLSKQSVDSFVSSEYYLYVSNVTTNAFVAGSGKIMTPLSPAIDSIKLFQKVNLIQGTQLQVRLSIINKDTGYDTQPGKVYALRQIRQAAAFKVLEAPSSFVNSPIYMGEQFEPSTKCIDMLRAMIHKFNLVFEVDVNDPKSIVIEPFDKWLSLGKVVDWTEKVQYAKRMSIKSLISEQAKQLTIADEKDGDRFNKFISDQNPEFANGSIRLTSDSNKPIGKKEVKGIFAPVTLGYMIHSGSLSSNGSPTFNLGTAHPIPHLYKESDSKQPTFKFKPRIGYRVDNIPIETPVGFYIGLPGTQGTDYIQRNSYCTLSNYDKLYPSESFDVASIKNLDFNNTYLKFIDKDTYPTDNVTLTDQSNTAFNAYWKNYIEGLYWDEAHKITVDMYFTPEEYKTFKLNDKIQIKNQYYRINKVSGYNLTQPDVVTVELLKYYDKINPEYVNGESVIKQPFTENELPPDGTVPQPLVCTPYVISYSMPPNESGQMSYIDCSNQLQQIIAVEGSQGFINICATSIVQQPTSPYIQIGLGAHTCPL